MRTSKGETFSSSPQLLGYDLLILTNADNSLPVYRYKNFDLTDAN